MAEVNGNEAESIRLEGNTKVKEKDYQGAITLYKKGIALIAEKHHDRVNFYKNLALCYLKLENYDDAIKNCSSALDINGGDVKALYRRAQAHEGNKNPEKAFEDAVKCTKLEPKNSTFTSAAHRLMKVVSSKRNTKTSTAGIGSSILTDALKATTKDERLKAAKNLAAFSQDEPGANLLMKENAINKLIPQLEFDGEDDVALPLLHTFASIGSNSWQRAVGVLGAISSAPAEKVLIKHIQSRSEKVARAAVMILMRMLEALSEEGVEDVMAKSAMNRILQILVTLMPSSEIISAARDAAIATIVKCAKKSDVAKRFIDLGGVKALLITASCAPSPIQTEDSESEPAVGIAMSKESRMQISVALSHLFAATCTSETGKKLLDKINPNPKEKRVPYPPFAKDCVEAIHWQKDPVSNIPAVQTLTCIIMGVAEIGNLILDMENVMERLVRMAKSDNLKAKCAAAEALSHAATNKERSKTLMASGFGILKGLYSKELPDAIRVRALTGLCKLGSQGGGFANKKTLADGAVVNLAKKIRPFLINDEKDLDCAKWASEGIAYLTLDADVKEMVVGDKKILKVIKKLCKDGDPTVQFGLANLLVNVSNTFDVPEENEEKETLKKIGKFAGEYIPEPHKLDAQEYVDRRIKILVESGMAEAMVSLSKVESANAREQVARVFLGMVVDKAHRGKIVQDGGARALVGLANDNTEAGKLKAAQALAKIGITSHPEMAFPGQRAAEVVRPLLLLANQPHGLLQFEACMALTNLASVSEDLRMRVVREDGIKLLEDLMFEDDWRIRRVATEALCNLMCCEKVYEMFATKEGKSWDRVKLWILLCGCQEDDFETARAASGGIALLSQSADVCKRITEEKQGMLIMKENAACGNIELQMRALHTIKNMVIASKEIAEIVVNDQGLELLSALHLTLENKQLKQYVTNILEILCEHEIITTVEDAHRKGFEAAATILDSFKRKEEEGIEEEDEEEDEEEGELDKIEEETEFTWAGAGDAAERAANEELEREGITLEKHDGVAHEGIDEMEEPKIEEVAEANDDTPLNDEYIEVGEADTQSPDKTDTETKKSVTTETTAEKEPESNNDGDGNAAEVIATAIEAGDTYIPSKSHRGSKAGYVYKDGNEGLGYYKDVVPQADDSAAPAPVVPEKLMEMMSLDLD